MRKCCKCGIEYIPNKNKGYRCNSCRKEYDIEWRKKRRADGLHSGGGKMPREYHQEYEKEYYKNEDNKKRRASLMKKYREDPKNRFKHCARWKLNHAVAAGKIERKPCEICGFTKADSHHDNYSEPLNVRWLCRQHHSKIHSKAEGKEGA